MSSNALMKFLRESFASAASELLELKTAGIKVDPDAVKITDEVGGGYHCSWESPAGVPRNEHYEVTGSASGTLKKCHIVIDTVRSPQGWRSLIDGSARYSYEEPSQSTAPNALRQAA